MPARASPLTHKEIRMTNPVITPEQAAAFAALAAASLPARDDDRLQVDAEQLRTLTPAGVVRAQREGRLDDLLGVPQKTAAPGGSEQITSDQLSVMDPGQIEACRKTGRLDRLLEIRPTA